MEPDTGTYRYIAEVLAYSRRYAETKCQSGGLDRVAENAMVLDRVWFERMQAYHGSLMWRHAYAIGLTRLAQRSFELCSTKTMLSFYMKACKWSPVIILKIIKNLPSLVLQRRGLSFPLWHTAENKTLE